MAAIGTTSGMVGHDIRNPLQAIVSELYVAKVELASITQSTAKNSLEEGLASIETEVSYINKIVQDLQVLPNLYNLLLRKHFLKKSLKQFCLGKTCLENGGLHARSLKALKR